MWTKRRGSVATAPEVIVSIRSSTRTARVTDVHGHTTLTSSTMTACAVDRPLIRR